MNTTTNTAPTPKTTPQFSPKPAIRRAPGYRAQDSPSPSFSPTPISPSGRLKTQVIRTPRPGPEQAP